MLQPATIFVWSLEFVCTHLAVWGCRKEFLVPVTPPLDLNTLPTAVCFNQSCLTVNTTSGLVEGFWASSLHGRPYRAFEGVPYAEPPVGRLRFREPKPLQSPWPGVLPANRHVTCMEMSPLHFYKVIGQEDCLVLNIYAPSLHDKPQKLPVYVFIHGGGFYWGSGHSNGPTYLMDSDIILVTINYRLGVLGFLPTPADDGHGTLGNWGLKDQSLALDWVQKNIAHFGGDPSRVTIGGQSAGGVSAHLHMLSPLSSGKFAGVIAQSGSALSHWAVPRGQDELRSRLAVSVGCHDENVMTMVECLREVPWHVLVAAQFDLFDWYWFHNPPILFGPIVETNHSGAGAFLVTEPMEAYEKGLVANVPLVTGVVRDEGQLFPLGMSRIPLGIHLLLGHSYETFPNLLMYDASNKSLTDSILAHYLPKWGGSGSVPTLSPGGRETYPALSEMVGDRNYYTGLYKTLELHSSLQAGLAPVYAYVFSYKGRHGIPELMGVSPKNWGVMHGDELQYLFNSSEFFAALNPQPHSVSTMEADSDLTMSEQLIELWTSFIRTGRPRPSGLRSSARATLEWKPYTVGDRRVLEINAGPNTRMREGHKVLHVAGVKFWKSIGLY